MKQHKETKPAAAAQAEEEEASPVADACNGAAVDAAVRCRCQW